MRNQRTSQWQERLEAIGQAARQSSANKMAAHDHAALVYWSRQEFLDTVVPFILDGLNGGDLVVHVAHDEPLPPVIEALEAAGVDVAQARASGRLLLLTADQAFAPEGRFDVERSMDGIRSMIQSATAAGARQVRFSVDVSYILSGTPGIEDFLEFDSRANDELFPQYPFICICAYDASRGVNHLVEDLFGTHPLVFVKGLPMANPYYQPWKTLSVQSAHLQRWKERYCQTARS